MNYHHYDNNRQDGYADHKTARTNLKIATFLLAPMIVVNLIVLLIHTLSLFIPLIAIAKYDSRQWKAGLIITGIEGAIWWILTKKAIMTIEPWGLVIELTIYNFLGIINILGCIIWITALKVNKRDQRVNAKN
jgi:hypothetical protein